MEALVMVRYRDGNKWRLKTVTHTSIDDDEELRELQYLLQQATISYQGWKAKKA